MIQQLFHFLRRAEQKYVGGGKIWDSQMLGAETKLTCLCFCCAEGNHRTGSPSCSRLIWQVTEFQFDYVYVAEFGQLMKCGKGVRSWHKAHYFISWPTRDEAQREAWNVHRGYLWPVEAHLLRCLLQLYTVVSKEERDVPACHLLSEMLCLYRLQCYLYQEKVSHFELLCQL